MAEVKIEWLQRAAGRDAGDVEIVERSEFVNGLLANGRIKILSEEKTESFPADLPGAIAAEEAASEVDHHGLDEFYAGTVPAEFVPELTGIDEDHARVAKILSDADKSETVKRTRQRSIDKNGE